MSRAAALLCLLVSVSAPAHAEVEQKLGAYLFGQPVGEVRLTLSQTDGRSTLTYRSTLHVVRDAVRLKQSAALEVEYADRLLRSRAIRCTATGEQAPTCASPVERGEAEAGVWPSLAAELLLAARPAGEHCLEVVDEESGARGKACARVQPEPGGHRFLSGTKLGAPFRARVDARGMLVYLELLDHGARFEAIDRHLSPSDEDLFADPVPSSGDVVAGLRTGKLRLRLTAPSEALALLAAVKTPGQKMRKREGSTAVVETRRLALPKSAGARQVLNAAAFATLKSRGTHSDCQEATEWFLGYAKRKGWTARQAVGFAWVDGRFAFHSWVLLETDAGTFPVDPLLAQVPADAGHVQLAEGGESAGSLLVAFRRNLSVEALP